MKSSGSLTEPLRESLVSFVLVVTYNGPKTTNSSMPIHLSLHALCFYVFKVTWRTYCKSFACHSTNAGLLFRNDNQRFELFSDPQKSGTFAEKLQVEVSYGESTEKGTGIEKV